MITDFIEFTRTFPAFGAGLVFCLGACIGSFLNVVIIRLPKGESLSHPRSHCGCGWPLAWHDNIPVFSWFFLGGRARCCRRTFSFRYPFIELLTAVVFVLSWLRFTPAVAVAGWLFVSVMIVIACIDVDHLMIPDRFSLGLGFAGVLLSSAVPAMHHVSSGFASLIIATKGYFIGAGLVFTVAMIAEAVLGREALGLADAKLAGALGAFCGWGGALFALCAGSMIVVAWSQVAARSKRARSHPSFEWIGSPGLAATLDLGVEIPFGPSLAIAGAGYFLFFRPLCESAFDFPL